MATIKYGMETLLEAFKPGLSALVMNSFKKRLEEKMQTAVDEVYSELAKELPEKIESKISGVLSPEYEGATVEVKLNLGNKKADCKSS